MCPQPRRKTKCVLRPKQSGTPNDVCLDGTAQLRIRFLLCAPNLIATQNVTYAPSSLEHMIMRVLTVLVCKDKKGRKPHAQRCMSICSYQVRRLCATALES